MEQSKFSVDLPYLISIDNGYVLVVLYAGASVDDTGIRCARYRIIPDYPYRIKVSGLKSSK